MYIRPNLTILDVDFHVVKYLTTQTVICCIFLTEQHYKLTVGNNQFFC